jgi:hypothetical protein
MTSSIVNEGIGISICAPGAIARCDSKGTLALKQGRDPRLGAAPEPHLVALTLGCKSRAARRGGAVRSHKSVRAEIVVRCTEHDGSVDFEQRLAVLIGLFDVPIFHPSNALLRRGECRRKHRIEHETGTAATASAIGDRGPAGHLPRELEGESRLPVCGAWSAVTAVPRPQAVGSAHIKVTVGFREQVDARPRHVAGKRPVGQGGHGEQTFELRRQIVDQRGEFLIHRSTPVRAKMSWVVARSERVIRPLTVSDHNQRRLSRPPRV